MVQFLESDEAAAQRNKTTISAIIHKIPESDISGITTPIPIPSQRKDNMDFMRSK